MGLRCGGGGEGRGDGPRLCAFSSWARSGGWQASGRLGSPACGGASPLSQRESACARRGCWAPAAEARRGPEQGQRAVLSPSCRGELPQADLRLLTPFGVVLRRAYSAAAGACVSRSTLAPLIRARFTLGSGRASLLCSRQPCCTLGGRVHADAAVSGNPEPTVARQDLEEVLDDV